MKALPLAHPIGVAAVALLALNDHVLKAAFPGFVTGKLSDVAGMIFFPLFLASVAPIVAPRARADCTLLVACLATALVFAATKTLPFANELYRVGWAGMQWPFRALRALVAQRPLPGLAKVVLVRDPSDLVAVPFVIVAYVVGARMRSTALVGSRQTPSPESFRGVRAVANLAGEKEPQTMMREGARALEAAGTPSRFWLLRRPTHGNYGPDGERTMDEIGFVGAVPP